MSNSDGQTLKQSFTRSIQSMILSGELKPGDKLLPERELAEKAGISRGSVNQSLLDLERMGFIRIVPRKGAFVADYMASSSADTLAAIMSYDSALVDPNLFCDLMAMRTLIERESVRLACGRVSAADIRLLNEAVNRIYSAESADFSQVLYQFHYQLTVLSGNRAFAMLFRSFEKMLRRLMEVHYKNPEEIRRALPLYVELVGAISRGDAAAADELISAILGAATAYLNRLL